MTYQFNGSLEDCLAKLSQFFIDHMVDGKFDSSHGTSAMIERFLRDNGRELGPEEPKNKVIEYTCKDHPEANGRQPLVGEVGYEPEFPLQNGDSLRVRIGQEGFNALSQMILDMMANTPSYGDGSVDLDRPADFKP